MVGGINGEGRRDGRCCPDAMILEVFLMFVLIWCQVDVGTKVPCKTVPSTSHTLMAVVSDAPSVKRF